MESISESDVEFIVNEYERERERSLVVAPTEAAAPTETIKTERVVCKIELCGSLDTTKYTLDQLWRRSSKAITSLRICRFKRKKLTVSRKAGKQIRYRTERREAGGWRALRVLFPEGSVHLCDRHYKVLKRGILAIERFEIEFNIVVSPGAEEGK